MQRRALLAALPASSVGISIAGRLSADSSLGRASMTTAEVPADPDDPVARATIGSPTDEHPPHRVRLWNDADDGQSVGLEIDGDTASFDGGYDLEPDAHVVVILRDRGAYDVTVTADGATTGSTTIAEDSFDQPCPGTELFVGADGDLAVTTETEAGHC